MNSSTTAATSAFVEDPGSFRDRANRVYDNGVTVRRGINSDILEHWNRLREAPFFRGLTADGKVVATETCAGADDRWAAYLSHERIPFISYPYEWSFGMLKDAALLHLDITEKAIAAGWTLKDATAYNVQWRGTKPVFIDVPSFEPYRPGDPWGGYRQFCMMFLYPLMLKAYRGIDYIPFLRSSLEGVDPVMADQILSGFTRLRKGVLGHVFLHSRMQNRYLNKDLDEAKSLTEEAAADGPKRAVRSKHSFAMVMGTIDGLRRTVEKLEVRDRRTTWGNYDTEHSYAAGSFDLKKEFVRKYVQAEHRKLAIDFGCNTGTFSRICAENSDYVLAVDGDEKAIDRLFRDLKGEGSRKILPLVANLGNISPNQGWRGRERRSFDERAQPQLILCLAIIHHIVISANIPLDEFLEWLKSFNASVVLEWVGPDDDMVKMLLRNRVNQYAELTECNFQAAVAKRFSIEDSVALKGGVRKLLYLRPLA